MLEVCLLGTGGMMPLPYRWLTSLMTRLNGSSLLIDCGEGTQITIKQQGWSTKPIDVVCFTHFHADHISGLSGLLLTMGNAERIEPLTLIGPKGLEKVVSSLRVIAPELPFELKYIELTEATQQIKINDYCIEAFRVNHNIVCYGYTITVPRIGKFDVEKAKSYNIPQKCWNKLQKGEIVQIDEQTFTPDMVLGEPRRGLKLTYCTDTRPTAAIVEHAKDADLFICEGMYGEKSKDAKAKEYKHMTFYEAATMAKEAQPKEMWLTHYSPSLNRPEEYKKDVCEIFPRTVIAKDRQSTELSFEED